MSAPTIVIGAGVNELVCAHYLARTHHSVIVLDPRPAREETPPEVGWIPPEIVRKLALERRGLRIERSDPWASAPLPDGGRLELWRDMSRSVEAIRKLSPCDAAKWPGFCERMARLAHLLESVYTAPPPDFMSRSIADLARLAVLGFRVRGLGRQGIEDLLRLLPMSAADLLDDHFECDALKGMLGAAGVAHLCQGPWSGGTAFRVLHRHVGSPPGVFRPPSSNIRRVLSDLPGIEIRRGADINLIVVRGGRVAGVVLASGEELSAALVVSGADPKQTLLELVDPGWLDPELVRALQNIRGRGVVARVTLTLDQPPGFSTLAVAPSLDYLERAYDDAKHGSVSRAPYLEARSHGKGADSRHRLNVHVQYAPYALAEGQWDEHRRAALGRVVVETLAQHVSGAVVEHVLSPRDLEEVEGWPEGQIEHVEPGLDQLLWMRPVPELARYRTPIEGLYLCGPGTHPGGSIAGASGHNAARVVLQDLKRPAGG